MEAVIHMIRNRARENQNKTIKKFRVNPDRFLPATFSIPAVPENGASSRGPVIIPKPREPARWLQERGLWWPRFWASVELWYRCRRRGTLLCRGKGVDGLIEFIREMASGPLSFTAQWVMWTSQELTKTYECRECHLGQRHTTQKNKLTEDAFKNRTRWRSHHGATYTWTKRTTPCQSIRILFHSPV